MGDGTPQGQGDSVKALVLREQGAEAWPVIERDFPDPVMGEGDVLVKVRATSLNYHDVFTRRGMPGIKIPLPLIMGLDCAGEIAGIGSGVQGWSVGDRVLIDPRNRVDGGLVGETIQGGLAELCVARAHQLIRIPNELSYVDAAALPCAYGSALRMMYTIGGVSRGERILILGASGGVGVCCVQLAKLAGATVIACAGSDEKAARLKELGADHTINYVEQDFVQQVYALHGKPARRGSSTSQGVDVVVNYTGGDTWVKSLRCLRVGGRLLTCGATNGYSPAEDLRFIWTFELKILGSNSWDREDLIQVVGLAQSGALKAVVAATFPLEEGAEALRRIENRQVFGKVVVTP
jgi:alcohol dehydrogenase